MICWHTLGFGTVMVDRIEFAAPFGLLGRLAEKLFLARYLRGLIETHNLHLTAGHVLGDAPGGQA